MLGQAFLRRGWHEEQERGWGEVRGEEEEEKNGGMEEEEGQRGREGMRETEAFFFK